jgi:DNA-binding transcriptional ArsR family regulator
MPKQSTLPARLFCALGDPTRLAVVRRLCKKQETVSGLAEPFDMALPSFLQHLKVLEESGWITSSKAGRVRTCAINPEALGQAGQWLQQQRVIWERRLDRLDDYLHALNKKEKQR